MHRRFSRRAASLLSSSGPNRLNLASGYHPKPGWINVDLFAPTADLRLDLRQPMPFPDGSIDEIYAEHFFEHLDYPNVDESMGWAFEDARDPSEALTFLRECRRVLKPGGLFNVVVPDAEGMIGVYVRRRADNTAADWWGPSWCDTEMHRVNYLFRQGREHKYAYDEETLTRVLARVGFVAIKRRPFDAAIDQPNHVIGSLCMIACSPGAQADPGGSGRIKRRTAGADFDKRHATLMTIFPRA